MSRGDLLRLGLVITTIGRPALAALLASAARSATPPSAVAVANQSGRDLGLRAGDYPFPLLVVTSDGGVSRGRNDGVSALEDRAEVLGFPNDDSVYHDDVFADVLDCFRGPHPPGAVSCRLQEPEGPRFALPPPGSELTRRTVWRAIEPAMFVRRDALEAVGGFSVELGSGGPTPWQSGDGTDLLLRLLAAGERVVARPDLAVHGGGERRDLDDDGLVAKHRAYARGTGYVYRVHGYPLRDRVRTVLAPVVKATRHDPRLRLSLRLAAARTLGRVEGLRGRALGRAGDDGRWDA